MRMFAGLLISVALLIGSAAMSEDHAPSSAAGSAAEPGDSRNCRSPRWAATASGAPRPFFSGSRAGPGLVSGFSGGHAQNPSYKDVCTGTTGHAEVSQITFDPRQVSFADLLQVFFKVHDPTTLNRQGADVGTQYCSVDLLPRRPAEADRPAIHPATGRRGDLRRRDRHGRRALQSLLCGRGLPPGLLQPARPAALLPRRDPAEGGEVQQAVPRQAQITGRNGRPCTAAKAAQ